MKLVVDANILFAALIKIGVTSDLIMHNSLELISVEFLLDEFKKYNDLIQEKTERTAEDFQKFMDIINRRIVLVPINEFEKFIEESEKISPDLKDSLYLALALKENCGVWSNDKNLKNQKRVKIYSTEDLIQELNKS